ncbi:MAG: hypothetical protein QM660_10730 [Dysgonomonas sp.]
MDIQKMIEEEARKYAYDVVSESVKVALGEDIYNSYINYAIQVFTSGYSACLSQLQHANRWRKVSEELPEKEPNVTMSQTLCLTRSKRYGIKLLAYNHDYNVWDDEQLDDYFCDKEVIEEWKPIE